MEVWAERPLAEEMLHYAASDVRYLHALHAQLNTQLPTEIQQRVGAGCVHACAWVVGRLHARAFASVQPVLLCTRTNANRDVLLCPHLLDPTHTHTLPSGAQGDDGAPGDAVRHAGRPARERARHCEDGRLEGDGCCCREAATRRRAAQRVGSRRPPPSVTKRSRRRSRFIDTGPRQGVVTEFRRLLASSQLERGTCEHCSRLQQQHSSDV
jgi:hypothetical protein